MYMHPNNHAAGARLLNKHINSILIFHDVIGGYCWLSTTTLHDPATKSKCLRFFSLDDLDLFLNH